MTWLQPQLTAFTTEAEAAFGGPVIVATLDDETWVRRFAPLHEPPSTPRAWVQKLDPQDDRVGVTDWFGLLDVGAATDERVLLRRLPTVGQYGDTSAITLVAARRREHIDKVLLQGKALWREWRRTEARVGDSKGRDLKLTAVAWDEIYLPPATLDEIRSNVLHFAAARDLYARLALPYRRGLLFYGAPGNGKTMTCRAIVTALGWPVMYVSPSSVRDSAEEVASSFEYARELAPCVLWFDDVDSLFSNDVTLSSFLNRLDGATASEGLLVLATTNQPERLDPAIVARPSRFDRIFEIPLPGATERDRFFARRFGDRIDAAARADLVQRTAGMSMAFVQEVFVGAALRALHRGEEPTADDAREVHAALSKHVKITARGFEEPSGTGFGRRSET